MKSEEREFLWGALIPMIQSWINLVINTKNRVYKGTVLLLGY